MQITWVILFGQQYFREVDPFPLDANRLQAQGQSIKLANEFLIIGLL